MLERRNGAVFECAYCEQLFDSKEKLYDHVEDHSETERRGASKGRKN